MAADPNRVPWGNMYEFTLSGTFVVAAAYLLLLPSTRPRVDGPHRRGFVLSVLMVAVIWLYDPVAPLTEALYSPWLVIHVVSAILATGAFTLGGICSALYLIKEPGEGAPGRLPRPGAGPRGPRPALLPDPRVRLPGLDVRGADHRSDLGAPGLARYWNWDPKEVWAFITWVVYAAYLHARSTAGWKGRNAAIIALVGLATLWFNFIGINFFSSWQLQHSYATGTRAKRVSPRACDRS